jgi:hypothetical protein
VNSNEVPALTLSPPALPHESQLQLALQKLRHSKGALRAGLHVAIDFLKEKKYFNVKVAV